MYEHDAVIRIINYTAEYIFLARPGLRYGKFHDPSTKDVEIPADQIDNTEIPPKGEVSVYTCGRSWEPSGTEGSMDLLNEDDIRTSTLYWNVPFWSKRNTFEVRNCRSGYSVNAEGYHNWGSGLGTVTVKIFTN